MIRQGDPLFIIAKSPTSLLPGKYKVFGEDKWAGGRRLFNLEVESDGADTLIINVPSVKNLEEGRHEILLNLQIFATTVTQKLDVFYETMGAGDFAGPRIYYAFYDSDTKEVFLSGRFPLAGNDFVAVRIGNKLYGGRFWMPWPHTIIIPTGYISQGLYDISISFSSTGETTSKAEALEVSRWNQ